MRANDERSNAAGALMPVDNMLILPHKLPAILEGQEGLEPVLMEA